MPLNKAVLIKAIEAALMVDEANPHRSAADVAADLADAIEEFVKSGDVVGVNTTVAAGIPVSTTGTATAQTGATTGPGTGSQTGVGNIQ